MGDPAISVGKMPKTRGFLALLLAVAVGLVLARVIMASLPATLLFVGGSAALVLTVLLQKTEILLYAWFVLTSFIILIVLRFFPQYYSFLGTALFWGLLSCILAAWAMDNIIQRRKFLAFDNIPLIVTVLLFIFWGSVSVFTSTNIDVSIRRFSHIVLSLAATYMFYDFFSRDQRNIRKILTIILIITMFVSISTIITAVHSLLAGKPIYKQLGLWLMGSNSLGGLLCFCLPLLLTAGLFMVNNRALRVLLAVVMLLALFLSFSRTAWIAMLVALAFLLHAGGLKRPLLLTIVFVGLVAVAWWFPFGAEDFFHYVTGERYTGRKTIWKAAWNMAVDHPFFGVGPGNAFGLMVEYLPTTFFQVLGPLDTHSVSLKNAAEMGFVTPLLRLFVIGLIIYNAVKIERTLDSKFLRLVCRGTTATFLAVLVRGMGENGSFLTPFSASEFHLLIPYMALALPFAAKNLEARHKDPGFQRSAVTKKENT